MLYIALNFRIYSLDFAPDSYRLGSTMPFFRNNTTVLSAWELPSNHKRDRSCQHNSGRAAGLCKLICFFTTSLLMPDDSIERKGSSESRTAIKMENL